MTLKRPDKIYANEHTANNEAGKEIKIDAPEVISSTVEDTLGHKVEEGANTTTKTAVPSLVGKNQEAAKNKEKLERYTTKRDEVKGKLEDIETQLATLITDRRKIEVSLPAQDLEKEVGALLKSTKGVEKVSGVKMIGLDYFELQAKIEGAAFKTKINGSITIRFKTQGDTIGVDWKYSHIKTTGLLNGGLKDNLKQKLNELSEDIKKSIEKTEKREVSSMKIKTGKLVVTFKTESQVTNKDNGEKIKDELEQQKRLQENLLKETQKTVDLLMAKENESEEVIPESDSSLLTNTEFIPVQTEPVNHEVSDTTSPELFNKEQEKEEEPNILESLTRGTKISYKDQKVGGVYEVKELPSQENENKYTIQHENGRIFRPNESQLKDMFKAGTATLLPVQVTPRTENSEGVGNIELPKEEEIKKGTEALKGLENQDSDYLARNILIKVHRSSPENLKNFKEKKEIIDSNPEAWEKVKTVFDSSKDDIVKMVETWREWAENSTEEDLQNIARTFLIALAKVMDIQEETKTVVHLEGSGGKESIEIHNEWGEYMPKSQEQTKGEQAGPTEEKEVENIESMNFRYLRLEIEKVIKEFVEKYKEKNIEFKKLDMKRTEGGIRITAHMAGVGFKRFIVGNPDLIMEIQVVDGKITAPYYKLDGNPVATTLIRQKDTKNLANSFGEEVKKYLEEGKNRKVERFDLDGEILRITYK